VPCFIVVSHQQQRGRLQGFPVIAPSRAPVCTISCGSDGKERRNYCMRHANEAHVSLTTME
jgi:hypothetical protein